MCLWLFWSCKWRLKFFNGFLKQVVQIDLAPPLISMKIIRSNHFGQVTSPRDGVSATCATKKMMVLVQIAPHLYDRFNLNWWCPCKWCHQQEDNVSSSNGTFMTDLTQTGGAAATCANCTAWVKSD